MNQLGLVDGPSSLPPPPPLTDAQSSPSPSPPSMYEPDNDSNDLGPGNAAMEDVLGLEQGHAGVVVPSAISQAGGAVSVSASIPTAARTTVTATAMPVRALIRFQGQRELRIEFENNVLVPPCDTAQSIAPMAVRRTQRTMRTSRRRESERPAKKRRREARELDDAAAGDETIQPLLEPAVAAAAAAAAATESISPSSDRHETCCFLPITAAAKATGVPKSAVTSWVTQGMVKHMRAGVKNSHRLVDVNDLRQLIAQRTEPALPRSSTTKKRVFCYVRVDEEDGGRPLEAHQIENLVQREGDRLCRLVKEHEVARVYSQPALDGLGDVGRCDDFERHNLNVIIRMILAREVDVLVVLCADALCPAATFPFFEWLCAQNLVSIVCLQPPHVNNDRFR